MVLTLVPPGDRTLSMPATTSMTPAELERLAADLDAGVYDVSYQRR